MCRLALLVALLLLSAVPAPAQVWQQLPGAVWSYNDVFTSVLTLRCGSALACRPTSNGGVILHSDRGTATVTAGGFVTPLTVSPRPARIPLGWLDVSISDPGYLFPSLHNAPLFYLDIDVFSAVLGAPSQNALGSAYVYRNGLLQPQTQWGYSTYLSWALHASPPGATYGGVGIDRPNRPVLAPVSGMYTINGPIGLAPEPASFALLGTGLVGTLAMRRRRRNQAQPS
jgi:hypothetical protein